MSRNKRIAYLLPAGIVVVGATIALVVALVGTAAAATVPAVDTGSQNFRGEEDLVPAARAMLAPKITEALQPGQTVSEVAPGNGSSSVGGQTSWTPASGPASAPQPGQTGWSDAYAGVAPMTSEPQITEALQPGQTVASAASPFAGYDPAHEHIATGNGSGPVGGPTSWTAAPGPASAPQPGQTGW
jgi:hypothetical protein